MLASVFTNVICAEKKKKNRLIQGYIYEEIVMPEWIPASELDVKPKKEKKKTFFRL